MCTHSCEATKYEINSIRQSRKYKHRQHSQCPHLPIQIHGSCCQYSINHCYYLLIKTDMCSKNVSIYPRFRLSQFSEEVMTFSNLIRKKNSSRSILLTSMKTEISTTFLAVFLHRCALCFILE